MRKENLMYVAGFVLLLLGAYESFTSSASDASAWLVLGVVFIAIAAGYDRRMKRSAPKAR